MFWLLLFLYLTKKQSSFLFFHVTGEIVGITMSPEPDLVASTKSSSSSDKSNSLPRTGQEPDLPAIDISSQPQISLSETFPAPHLPHAEPSKKDGALESLPEVSAIAPAPAVLGDIRSQPGIGIGYKSSCDTEGASIRATPFKVHGPSQLVQVSHQYPLTQVPSVPVAPPRKKRRNRHNTDVSTTRPCLSRKWWSKIVDIGEGRSKGKILDYILKISLQIYNLSFFNPLFQHPFPALETFFSHLLSYITCLPFTAFSLTSPSMCPCLYGTILNPFIARSVFWCACHSMHVAQL